MKQKYLNVNSGITVWIGGGEEELVVLNPRAIVLGKGESFSVRDNPKFSDDDADVE
jgi:hypothetical protein